MLAHTCLRLEVRYDAPVRGCRRALYVLPLPRANQIVRMEWLKVWPTPDEQRETPDRFGNRRLELFHARLNGFALELEVAVETSSTPVAGEGELGVWKMSSRGVSWVPELECEVRAIRYLAPLERAARLCEWCFESLEYTDETDDTPAAAAELWRRGRGNCAEFAHLFLAACRMSGLPARYVAGFGIAPGQMHAWAEVWARGAWHAFDPTHGRALAPGSIAVAIGRDFYDCAPHAGTFYGQTTARLALFCRTNSLAHQLPSPF